MWDLHYNFSSYYQTEAITAESLHRLYGELVGGGSLMERYLLANTAGLDTPDTCPGPCRMVHLCSIPNVDITNFIKCLSQASGVSSLNTTPTSLSIWITIQISVTGNILIELFKMFS